VGELLHGGVDLTSGYSRKEPAEHLPELLQKRVL
jgi:hypothetical protein